MDNVQYVSFETAKLAKEKGFDLPCKRYFRNELITSECSVPLNSNATEGEYSQPTQDFLNDWLRDKYALKVVVVYRTLNRYSVYVCDMLIDDYADDVTRFYKPNMTYKEAYELGLQEALKLI